MISIPGSLSFAKLVMMSSAPEKSAGDVRYASQDPFIHGNQRRPISTPICIGGTFFLRRTQKSVKRRKKSLQTDGKPKREFTLEKYSFYVPVVLSSCFAK